jgi:ADP-ribose pyrophosphatase YjhB (NUDIX family)
MKDAYCSHCGAAHATPLDYPRTCPNPECRATVWANPIPVSVVLAPVVCGDRTGLLVIRRAIEPRRGRLALVGGFLEAHESWQRGGAREVREEAGATVDPAGLEPFWFASSEPRPDRVLLFSVAAPLRDVELPPLPANPEVDERGLIFGPEGLEDVFAFPLHVEAARRYFASRGVAGPNGYQVA